MTVAQIVVDIKHKAVDKVFDYEVPGGLVEVVSPGARVMVPFGSRVLLGFVLHLKATSDYGKPLRLISELVDVVPVLNAELLALGIELARLTGATMIACFEAMIPAAMKAKYRKLFVHIANTPVDLALLALFDAATVVDSAVVAQELLPVFKKAIAAGAVEVVYEASVRLKKKTKRYVKLVGDDAVISLVKAKKQRQVVTALQDSETPIAKADLEASDSVLKALCLKGVIEFLDVEVYRTPKTLAPISPAVEIKLNRAQQQAVAVIKNAENGVVLVHGVTGSGKTEVYLEAIAAVIACNQQALMLIPEIGLTTQLMSRFQARFGEQVALMHSGLSMGERYDEWRRIWRGEVKIVVGARSAVFAPFSNLGIIIVDEEHEATYKQEEMPRYHAIEVAKYRGKVHNCPVVLGSATPSLEAYARAIKGVYTLVNLPSRAVVCAKLPEVLLIDMNQQAINAMSKVISRALQSAISKRLASHEQVILFLNRRGYSNFLQCRECQAVVSCPNCDVTLTFHKQAHGLRCHYCNFMMPVVTACPSCASREVRFFGTGTQQLEEFIKTTFPSARVLRMDVDSTSKKGDHQRIISAFEKHEADLLIGTQMVVKGLDFPKVTLVGVLDADMMLHYPDFRAAERTFQILTQVAGRAGRHQAAGQVYIETYSPNHYVMQHVKNQDYVAFYAEEMQMRRRFKYTPYFFHAKVLLSSVKPEALLVVCEQVNEYLRTKLAGECLIIGPTAPPVARVNNRFRMHFILKYKQSAQLMPVMTQLLAQVNDQDVSLAVDYFPVYLA